MACQKLLFVRRWADSGHDAALQLYPLLRIGQRQEKSTGGERRHQEKRGTEGQRDIALDGRAATAE